MGSEAQYGNHTLIGDFPVGGRLSLFLLAWQQKTSDQLVLEVIRQGYSFPFVRVAMVTDGERGAVGRRLVSPYQKGHGDCPAVTGPGGVFPLLPGYQVPPPSSTSVSSIHTSMF